MYFPSWLMLHRAVPGPCCMCRSHPWSLGLKFVLSNSYSSLRKHVAPLSTGAGVWHHTFAMQMLGVSFWEAPRGLFKNRWVGLVGSGGGEMLQTKTTPMLRDHQLNVWQLRQGTGMDLPPQGGDGLLEQHITIKGTSSRFSPCSAEYPPLAPDRVVSGVTPNTNSSPTSKYSEHLKAFLSQQTGFSTSKPLLASPSNRCNTKKTQTQKPTYRAAPSETEGMGGKLQAVAEMKDAAMTFC